MKMIHAWIREKSYALQLVKQKRYISERNKERFDRIQNWSNKYNANVDGNIWLSGAVTLVRKERMKPEINYFQKLKRVSPIFNP